jgi:hypothetical protein
MNELKRCGYQQVTGYIWYTKTNQRVMIWKNNETRI